MSGRDPSVPGSRADSPASTDQLIDGPARHAIRHGLDRTLIVEAAAGTGKTTELVQRIVAIVASGLGKLSSIVAVTFTEKAAGEMKLRIRTELDRALTQAGRTVQEVARIRVALSELEAARIGTIHGLCSDLLRAHPVEAGVDPAFEVLDAGRSRNLLERSFATWFERVVEAPPEGVRRVLARKQVNDKGRAVRETLFQAVANLVDTRDFTTPYRRDPFERESAIDECMRVLRDLALVAKGGGRGDPLAVSLRSLNTKLTNVRGLSRDAQEEFLRQLATDRSYKSELRGKSGRGEVFAGDRSRADVLAQRDQVRSIVEQFAEAAGADLAACLSRELLPAVDAYQREKARLGALDFFDLLLFTRRLIAEVESVRGELQSRITHLFVDEFQDTDPVQAEILLLLAADSALNADPWQARIVAGKLFLVGDPKQSIYRFRRADVLLYDRVKQHLLKQGAELVQLSTSFRSLPGIQQCVNGAFAALMTGDREIGQADYVPLSPFRAARDNQPDVVALPVPEPYGGFGRITKAAIDASLPDGVAAWIDWLLRRSGYVVQEAGRDVPVEARHVCLLFKRFRSFDDDVTREYVRALEARRIPHVLSGGRSFHAREEIIALRAVLTAIEWPDDALHVYASLRGPFVALSDESLLSFKRKVHHLHPMGQVDLESLEPAEREVADVLALLASLHRSRNRRPIASTILSLLEALRAHAGIAIWPTGEQALGNVLRVLDFARSHERRGGVTSFRGFVEWLDRQAELAEAPEAPVIEEGSDGVRIMTVHTAKGLEFPVVVLCDPNAPRRVQRASRHIDGASRLWAQSLCDVEPRELVEHREHVRDQDESEVVRVAYVAATRAKEILVVPTCGDSVIEGWLEVLAPALYPAREAWRRPQGHGPGTPQFGGDTVLAWPMDAPHDPDQSVAPGLHQPQSGSHRVVWWDPHFLDIKRPPVGGLTQQELLVADEQHGRDEQGMQAYQRWILARSELRTKAGLPSWVSQSITQAAHDELRAPVLPTIALEVIDSGALRPGRPSGARFGTLVHALLERASAQADATELGGLASFVGRSIGATSAEMTRAVEDTLLALKHPLWERVRSAETCNEVFREFPVTVRAPDGTLLDGIIDLAFRERDASGTTQLVVVDFKTDVEVTDLRAYERQLALYCQALSQVFSEPCRAVLFRV